MEHPSIRTRYVPIITLFMQAKRDLPHTHTHSKTCRNAGSNDSALATRAGQIMWHTYSSTHEYIPNGTV